MTLLDKISDFLKEHGVITVIALGLFGVIFGWVPSVLTALLETNIALLQDTNRRLENHIDSQAVATSKLINLALTDCVNKALADKNLTAARSCTDSVDDSSYIQKKRLERLITEKEDRVQ